jgi:hypothetical protein
MSETGLVIVIAVLAFAAGLAAAIRTFPPVPSTRSGGVVFWVSRLTAAAALATLAVDVYTMVKRQTSEAADGLGGDVAAVSLAQDLAGALYDAGVLASFAAVVTLIGVWLLRSENDEGTVRTREEDQPRGI